MNERKVTDIIGDSDPDKIAFVNALFNVEILEELPDTEEEILEWEKKNPERAKQLETTIDHIIGEFGLIAPTE